MARPGSQKKLSRDHEEFVAALYGGSVSPSSGAAAHDRGDVRVTEDETLMECKYTGAPGPCKAHEQRDCIDCTGNYTLLKQFEKVTDEAWAENRQPAVALRYYAPHSVLANREGWVDLTVRLAKDDAERSEDLRYWREKCNEVYDHLRDANDD